MRITHIFETHIHNDYVTGGLALARATGAAYHVNADDPVAYERTGVRDGDVIDVEPGHAGAGAGHPGPHLHPPVLRAGGATAPQTAVFSGGSLLFGSTGRPDLLGPDHTHDLVHHQYASAQRLAAELPDQTRVMPTHGFGSFCSATQSEATASTIGWRRRTNPALTQDEQRYVADASRRPGRLPGLLRADGPGQHRRPLRAGPDPAGARRRRSELRRRLETGSGWSICAPAPPSPPGTRPAP